MRETLLGPARAIGSGIMRAIVGTDPPAGTAFVETVPTGFQWRIVAINVTLVTTGAGNRRLQLILRGSAAGPTFYRIPSSTLQTAGQSRRYIYGVVGENLAALSLSNDRLCMLPDGIILGPGMQFASSSSTILAADNFGAPAFLVEEWAF